MSQDSWENVAVLGAVMAVVGVALESVDWFSKFRKHSVHESILANEPSWSLTVEFCSITLVVLGLCVEIFATYKASLKAHEKIEQLTAVSKNAFDNAASAAKEAGDSKLLAAQIGTTNAQLVASNLLVAGRVEELRAKNDELEAKQRPRTITLQQVTNFIFLTERVPKFKIRIAVGASRDETASFAYQLRSMLNEAGFAPPDSDTNIPLGVYQDITAVGYHGIGDTNTWRDLAFVTSATNNPNDYSFNYEATNGFRRAVVSADATNQIYAGFISALLQSGITVSWMCKASWVIPNNTELFVQQRPY
jgi:hypothetical protein